MSSIVGSIISFSTRSSRSVAPARAGLFSWQAIMDSLLAIATGLALRVVVSFVTNDDNRTTSTLIGLWEGIILMHFLNKMPRSFDPYIAYGVRLFIDLLVTESLYRLVVVLLWTGMGMVLADITPIFWYDMGMRKMWHRFRRDLYIMSRSIRSFLPFATKPRSSRVRFHERTRSASRGYAPTPSIVTTVPSEVPSTSTTTTTRSTASNTTATPIIPVIPPAPPARPRKVVPGSFPGYASETDSVAGLPPLPLSSRSVSSSSISDGASDVLATPRLGTSHSRIHRMPDELLTSSGSSVSSDTDVPDPLSLNPAELPDIDLLQEEAASAPTQPVKGEETPRQLPVVLPPTPADTLRDIDVLRANESRELPPPSATIPIIPDQNEWNFSDGWETIDRSEAPVLLLPDQQEDGDTQDRKGKQKEKTLPPTPEDSGIKMPVPHPATPPIPVPEPHPDTVRQDSLTPPPSFDDIYGPDANDIVQPVAPTSTSLIDFAGDGNVDQADSKGLSGASGIEAVTQEDQHREDGTGNNVHSTALDEPQSQVTDVRLDAEPSIPPPSPSPPPSPARSSPLPLDERINEAFSLRRHVMELTNELKALEQAQAQAGSTGDKAGAIAQKVEVEKKKRELERARRRLARRTFDANNSEETNEISLTGILPGDAVNLVEETLERLLLSLDHGYTELIVTAGTGKKGLPVRNRVTEMLTEHHIDFEQDANNARKIIIQLPSESTE